MVEQQDGAVSVGARDSEHGARETAAAVDGSREQEKRDDTSARLDEKLPACARLRRRAFLRIFRRVERNTKRKTLFLRKRELERRRNRHKEEAKSLSEQDERRLQLGRLTAEQEPAHTEEGDGVAGSTAAVRASAALARLTACEARVRQRALLPVWALRVLMKNHATRSNSEIEALLPLLRSKSWVDLLPHEVLSCADGIRACMSAMKVQKMTAGDRFIRHGDAMDAMYVVIEGTVNQYVLKDGQFIPDPTQPVLYSGSAVGHLKLDHISKAHHHSHSYKDSGAMGLGGFASADLEVGPAGATLLTMEQYPFEKAMEPLLERVIRERALFLQGIKPFSTWTDEERMAMAGEFREQHCPSNTLIIRQGGIANDFFIILSGIVSVIKQIDAPARSMTTLRVGLNPSVMNYHSSHPAPAEGTCRRSTIMDARSISPPCLPATPPVCLTLSSRTYWTHSPAASINFASLERSNATFVQPCGEKVCRPTAATIRTRKPRFIALHLKVMRAPTYTSTRTRASTHIRTT